MTPEELKVGEKYEWKHHDGLLIYIGAQDYFGNISYQFAFAATPGIPRYALAVTGLRNIKTFEEEPMLNSETDKGGPGLTLREYAAIHAGPPPGSFMRLEDEFDGEGADVKWHARWAVAKADALIAELNREPK